jgi:PAS domain S-box-containing protein
MAREKKQPPAGVRKSTTGARQSPHTALHEPDVIVPISREARAQAALEVAPDGLVIANEAGNIIQVNRQTEILFGYDREELMGKPIEILLPARAHQIHELHRQRYMETPRTRQMGNGMDLTGLRKDGSEFPVEISLSAISIEGEVQVIAIVRDITERHRLEQRTHDVLEGLMAMAEEAVNVVHPFQNQKNTFSPPGAQQQLLHLAAQVLECRFICIMLVDRTTEHITLLGSIGLDTKVEEEWSASLPHSLTLHEFLEPATLEQVQAGQDIIFTSPRLPLRQLNGNLAHFTGIPMQIDDHLTGILILLSEPPLIEAGAMERGAAHSVARLSALAIERERILHERQIYLETESHRALLQMVIDQMPSGVYLVRGNDARLVLANRAAMETWGGIWEINQPMLSFLKSNGIRIQQMDGRPLPFNELATLRAVQNGSNVFHHQEVIRHADGISLPVLMNAVALDTTLFSGVSNEPGALVVVQDVTALKEAERLKDEFIGIAAHELRNPLAGLRGFTDMLIVQTERGHGPKLADWQAEAIEAIDQSSRRLVELTDDLLDVTRLQAGRLQLHREVRDIVAIARQVCGRQQMAAPDHQIILEAVPETIFLPLDPLRIEQVLNNVIHNAIKYSPDETTVTVEIRAEETTHKVTISVTDHGIGIPADQQARIFNRFTRGENVQMAGIPGTGLGLYLCRELVERHGGRIWFHSHEDEGSVFYFTLPMQPIIEENVDNESLH